MVLTFIGFSGCGKSHLARRFAHEHQWKLYSCDTLIEEKLATFLPHGETPGTRRVAHWLGLPSSAGFCERQEQYLRAETEVMEAICHDLKTLDLGKAVVDTTGSVIYMSQSILETLKGSTRVLYFQIPEDDEERMFEQFVREPKPLIWRDSYQQLPGESEELALHRSYERLLHERTTSYERYAEIFISAGFADRPVLTPECILEKVSRAPGGEG